MTIVSRWSGFAAFLAVLAGFTLPAEAMSREVGSVYLMRGFANVFSLGMDALGDKLRARGVHATVLGFTAYGSIAQQVEARYATDRKALPVIIMGHSLGANSALLVADELQRKNIPVALVVIFDATSPIAVPANVRHVINFHAPDGFGVALKGAPGFRGNLQNIDVSKIIPDIDHVSIDKANRLHGIVISEVLRLVGRRQLSSR